MAIVECAVEMNTTAQKSSETTEEYFNIFEARRNTVNAHNGRVGYHEGMFKKTVIKIMDEKKDKSQGRRGCFPQERDRGISDDRELRGVPRMTFYPIGRQRLVQGHQDRSGERLHHGAVELPKYGGGGQ